MERGGLRAGLVAGALATVLTLTSALSYAALIFSGGLSSGLHFGMTASLLAAAILSLAFCFFGSLRFEIGGPGGNAAAVVAAVAAAIDHGARGGSSESGAVATVLVAIALSTLATGLVLFLLGVTRAGRWMRFIPYPVVGGVLGAAGWLFVAGSLRVIGTTSPQELGIGIGYALLLVAFVTRVKHALALPAFLALGVAGFYAALAASGISVAQARALGWLFTVPAGSAFANPWDPAVLHAVAWPLLGQHPGDLLTLFAVSALAVLLGTSGIELATKTDGDLDRELKLQGAANVFCGFGGGLVASGQLSNTIMSFEIAKTSRVPPAFVAIASVCVIFGGTAIVESVPRFVFGALIFTVGFNLLNEWCIRTARRLPLHDYLSILAIVAVVVRFGYVAGVITGLLIGSIIFVVTYSQVRVIKHSLSGAEFRSGIVRSPAQSELLQREGHVIRVLVLQGFIFFGMADRLYRSVKELIEARDAETRFLIFDFRSVNGIDSSAASSFAKIRRLAEQARVVLIFAGLAGELERNWRTSDHAEMRAIPRFDALDGALEFCESGLLAEHPPVDAPATTLDDWLQAELGDGVAPGRLLAYLQQRRLEEGETLCTQGEPADAMYFIERGRVGVRITIDGNSVRLRSLADRTILGEMGLYRSRLRSASVVAEQASTVHVLTREAFARMERDDSALAAAFNAAIVRTLADRLEFENAMVAALQR